jgi:Cu/Ag efflux pump CusA
MRRDSKRIITVEADKDVLGCETQASVFNRVRPHIETIKLPSGYKMERGGEFETSSDE